MQFPYRHVGDRLLDLSVAVFAWWTVCCNATVVTGGTGRQLLITAGVSGAVLLLGCGLLWLRRVRAATARVGHTSLAAAALANDTVTPAPAARRPFTPAAGFAPAFRDGRVWALLPTLGVLVWWPESVSDWVLWSLPAALVVLFTVLSLREPWPVADDGPEPPAWHGPALWVLALGAALITACLHLPNTDDVLYVNIATALADQPARVLFSEDTLHGATAIPHKAYHVHAFELLAGALSLVSGVAPLAILHLGLAVFAGFVTPLAWARLFRLLDHARALWMVVVVMAWYVLEGTTPFDVSMHAFARLFQGKAILATVGVPAIAAYGIAFGLRPSVARLSWLGAAQVAGLGLSSTGIWLCPLVAVTSVAATQALRLGAIRTLALACVSSGYVLAMGIWVLVGLRHGGGATSSEAADLVARESVADVIDAWAAVFRVDQGFERIRKALTLTFFGLDRGLIYGAFLLLAWPLSRTALSRRYIAAFMCVGLFILCSPWLAAIVAHDVTGFSTYPRVTWFLPYGVALAICFVSPLATSGRRVLRHGSLALCAALLAAFFAQVPKRTVFEAAHLAWPPGLKVERSAYDVALRLKQELPAGSAVLAPRSVSLHLPMLLASPLPIMTKARFFSPGDPERGRRSEMRRRVERKGKPLDGDRRWWLRKRLDDYRVRAVVLTFEAAQTRGMRRALDQAGFRRIEHSGPYLIWIRDHDTSPDARRG